MFSDATVVVVREYQQRTLSESFLGHSQVV